MKFRSMKGGAHPYVEHKKKVTESSGKTSRKYN